MNNLTSNLNMKNAILYVFFTGNFFLTFMVGALDFNYFKILAKLISILGTSYYLFSLCILYQVSRVSKQNMKRFGLALVILGAVVSLTGFVFIGIFNPFGLGGIFLPVNIYICMIIALGLGVISYLKLLPILKNNIQFGLKELV